MPSERNDSLWRASSGERFASRPLGAGRDVDIVIVGGGFTGCSAALEAARQGASVCLLEARHVAHGGSGRNVGLVNAGLWLTPDGIIEHLGVDAAERLIRELGEGPRRVWSIIARENIACEGTPNGTLHCAHSVAGLKDLRARLAQGLRYGAPVEMLDAAETARRTGTRIYYGSLLDRRAGTIQPLAYCQGLARAAVAAGAAIHEDSPVSKIEHVQGRWVVASGGHRVRAKALLLATNAYQMGVNSPFQPSYVPVSYCQFATAPMPDAARAEILAGAEGCWDTAMVMSSFRIDQAGRMIVGGVGNSAGPGGAIHAGWGRRKLRQLFPVIGDLPFEYGWRGRISMTRDHVPKIVAFGPHAYAGFGYSGRGISPGTVFGTQMAKALLHDSADHLPLTPIDQYSEAFTRTRAAYYEVGAGLTHALTPTPFIS